jgi:hypothetical protein
MTGRNFQSPFATIAVGVLVALRFRRRRDARPSSPGQ